MRYMPRSYLLVATVLAHETYETGGGIMKTGLIVFGVIFFVIGGLFFFLPSQTAQATTTTVGETTTDTRTSYATVSIPLPVTYAVLLIGLILLVLGFATPSAPRKLPAQTSDVSESTTSEVTETGDEADGVKKRKVTHERHVQHTREK